MSISDEDMKRLADSCAHRSDLKSVAVVKMHAEIERLHKEIDGLREQLVIKNAAREMTTAAYNDAEADIAKAREALDYYCCCCDCSNPQAPHEPTCIGNLARRTLKEIA